MGTIHYSRWLSPPKVSGGHCSLVVEVVYTVSATLIAQHRLPDPCGVGSTPGGSPSEYDPHPRLLLSRTLLRVARKLHGAAIPASHVTDRSDQRRREPGCAGLPPAVGGPSSPFRRRRHRAPPPACRARAVHEKKVSSRARAGPNPLAVVAGEQVDWRPAISSDGHPGKRRHWPSAEWWAGPEEPRHLVRVPRPALTTRLHARARRSQRAGRWVGCQASCARGIPQPGLITARR